MSWQARSTNELAFAFCCVKKGKWYGGSGLGGAWLPRCRWYLIRGGGNLPFDISDNTCTDAGIRYWIPGACEPMGGVWSAIVSTSASGVNWGGSNCVHAPAQSLCVEETLCVRVAAAAHARSASLLVAWKRCARDAHRGLCVASFGHHSLVSRVYVLI